MFDLKRFRVEKKISQKELASALGVGQSFISQVEQGKDPMPEDWIGKISEIYDVENISDYIVTESDKSILIKGIGNTTVAGSGNNIHNSDALLEISHNYQELLKKKDEQMDRLISVIEKLTNK